MDFKFNFGGDDTDNNAEAASINNTVPVAPAMLIQPNIQNLTPLRAIEEVTFKGLKQSTTGHTRLKKYVIRAGEGTGKLSTITNTSDLEPGVYDRYEGGFKLWECAVDLTNFLSDNNIDFTNKKVLELGCGHGMPGIYALHKGAQHVGFQDYNEEVINDITIPNVYLNFPQNGLSRSSFYSGDWVFVDELLGNEKFDAIFTTDTLYSPPAYPKLYNLMKKHLKEDGIAYIAAKKYYFGVSGSTHLFLSEIKEKKLFNVKSVEEIRDGVSNVREVICLTH